MLVVKVQILRRALVVATGADVAMLSKKIAHLQAMQVQKIDRIAYIISERKREIKLKGINQGLASHLRLELSHKKELIKELTASTKAV